MCLVARGLFVLVVLSVSSQLHLLVVGVILLLRLACFYAPFGLHTEKV